jgi:integrase/recombinase XerD
VVAANTVSAYRRDLTRYADALLAAGHSTLASVAERDVAGYLGGLREGEAPLSAASAARALSAVRGLHRFAAREGLVADDPARSVRPPSLPRRLPRSLGIDEVRRLLEACPADDVVGLRDAALLEFLYGTGARVSEAVGCSVDDLDLAEATVLLRGKGGRHRLVPVGGYARAAIQAYLVRSRPALLTRRRTAGRESHLLFRNARGAALTRQGAWLILRDAADRARVTGAISPHALRHSYATHLLDGGADVRVVQELLGHASVTTTQVYTLVTVDKLREVYATTHPRARA